MTNLKDFINKNNLSCFDIFDTVQDFNEGEIFVVFFPKSLGIDNYKKNVLYDILQRNPSALICINGTEEFTKDINNILKIYVSIDELNEFINYKYSLQPKNLIGITGSFGKSSTCMYLYNLLKLAGKKVFLSSSIGRGSNVLENNYFTTASRITLKRILHKNNSCEYGIIECSSAGIESGRISGLKFNSGIFTGYCLDHLDFHNSEENYILAKVKLFNEYIDGQIFINKEISDYIKAKIKKTYNEYPSKNIYFEDKYFNINEEKFQINNIDGFQKINLLGAMSLLTNLQIKLPKEINLQTPKGRGIFIGKTKNNANVFVDGASGIEKLEILLKTFNLKNNNNAFLIGTAGHRIKADIKMAAFLEKYGHVIITDDDPREYDPKFIRLEMKKYCQTNPIEIGNRCEAIKYILNMKVENIFILGKSSEANQSIKYQDYIVYYNEDEIVDFILNNNMY